MKRALCVASVLLSLSLATSAAAQSLLLQQQNIAQPLTDSCDDRLNNFCVWSQWRFQQVPAMLILPPVILQLRLLASNFRTQICR